MRYEIRVYLKKSSCWIFTDMPSQANLTDKDLVLDDSVGRYFFSRDCIEMVSCCEWTPPRADKPVAGAPRKAWYERIFGGC